MLLEFDAPPLCLKSNENGCRLVVGFVDGTIRFYDTTKEAKFIELWKFQTKSSVRGVDIDEVRKRIYAVTKNRALCVFDMNTGKRIRCILKCHTGIPTAICTLPPTALKSQQLATADETGEVKTWNLDSQVSVKHVVVRKWNEQSEDINDLKVDVKSNLLAPSSDGTIGAYDLRKAKFKVRSELMHSELFAVCPTNRSVYVGGEDGYVEVFNLNEYGNLLERIESGFEMGVNGIVELRDSLLGITSQGSNKMRLLNVKPSKRLGFVGCHGDEKSEDDGIDGITISGDKSTVFTMIALSGTIKKWDMRPIVAKIPILRAQDAKSKKGRKLDGFFDGMAHNNEEEEQDSDDNDSDNDEPSSKKSRYQNSDDDDEEVDDEEGDDEDPEDEKDGGDEEHVEEEDSD